MMISSCRLLVALTAIASLVALPTQADDGRAVTIETITGVVGSAPGGDGATREVEIDRGAQDGLVVGALGMARSLEPPSEVGRAEVLAVEPHVAHVRVTLLDPASRIDVVDLPARVPKLAARSILWELAKRHVEVAEFCALFAGETPALVNARIDATLADVRAEGDRPEAKTPATPLARGRFRGATIADALRRASRNDLLDFLSFTLDHADPAVRRDWSVADACRRWVEAGAPPGPTELAALLREARSADARAILLDANRDAIAEQRMLPAWRRRAVESADAGAADDAIALAAIVEEAARRVSADNEARWALYVRGYALDAKGRTADARDAFDSARTAFRTASPHTDDDFRGEASCAQALARSLLSLDQYREALDAADVADRLRSEHDIDKSSLPSLLHAIANLRARLGDAEGSRQAAERAIRLCSDLGDRASLANARIDLGIALAELERRTDAATAFENAATDLAQLGDRAREAGALANAGQQAWLAENYRRALTAFEACAERRRGESDPAGLALARRAIGLLHANLGELDGARSALLEAARLLHDLGDSAGEVQALDDLAAVQKRSGDVTAARESLTSARALCRTLGDAAAEARLLDAIDELEATPASTLPVVVEDVTAVITSIDPGDGPTRTVDVDRGSADGLVAGWRGTVRSVHSPAEGRTAGVIGRAEVLATDAHEAHVRVILDEPTGAGLVILGDAVEVKARVPALPQRSVLWALARRHVALIVGDEPIAGTDLASLWTEDSDERANETLARIAGEVRRIGPDYAETALGSDPRPAGRFAGRRPRDVAASATPDDVRHYLEWVDKYSDVFAATQLVAAKGFVAWLGRDESPSVEEIAATYTAATTDEARNAALDASRDALLQGHGIERWHEEISGLVKRGDIERALALADLTIAASKRFGSENLLRDSLVQRAYVLASTRRIDDARRAYEEAIASYRAADPRGREEQFGEALSVHNLGVLEEHAGRHQEALARFREAMDLERPLGPTPGSLAVSHSSIGGAQFALGDFAGAAESYARAADLSRTLDDQAGLPAALVGLAKAKAKLGNSREAMRLFGEARDACQRTGERAGEADALEQIGGLHWNLGEHKEALVAYQACLDRRRGLDDRPGVASALTGIGKLQWNLGEYAACLDAHVEALRIRRALDNRAGQAISLVEIGDVQRERGDLARALASYEEARSLRRSAGDEAGEATAIVEIGRIQADRGEFVEARKFLDEAIAIQHTMGARAECVRSLRVLANIEARRGDVAAALARHREALELARSIGARAEEIATLLAMAGTHAGAYDFDPARGEAEEALRAATETSDRAREAECQQLLGSIAASQYRFDDAVHAFDRALEIFRAPDSQDAIGEARTLDSFANALYVHGEFDAARARYQEALAIAERTKARSITHDALLGIAEVSRTQGNLDAARRTLEHALEFVDGNDTARAQTDQELALVHGDLGDDAKADEFHAEALRLFRAIRNDWGIAAVLNNRAEDYLDRGDVDRALADLTEGLALAEKLNDKQLLAALLQDFARAHLDTGNAERAVDLLERAAALSREIGQKRFVGDALKTLAQARREQARLRTKAGDAAGAEQALAAADAALDESARLFHEMRSPVGEALALAERGAVLLQRGRAADAKASLENALRLTGGTGERQAQWKVLYGLSRAEEALGDLDVALGHRRRAVDLLEDLRGALGADEHSAETFLRSKIDVYESLADLLVRVQEKTTDAAVRKRLAEEALELVARARFERLKSGTQSVSSSGSAKLDEIWQRYRQKERDRARLATERDVAVAVGNSARAESLSKVLATTDEEMASLFVDLRAQDPDVALRLRFDPRRIGAAMTSAPPHATLVVYFPGETSLDAWIFGNEGFRELRRHEVSRAALYALVRNYRDRIDEVVAHAAAREPMGRGFGPAAEADDSNPEWYRENAKATRLALAELYEHLVAPFASDLADAEPLLVLPYGQLSYLPFEALIAPDGRFLGETKRVVYFTSEAHLSDTLASFSAEKEKATPPREDVWVAFADPRGKLQSSLEEADEIGALYKTHEVHSQRTNDASQEDLERLRADCTILHFATHGFLNGEKPSRTFLELATPPGDGQLAQSEIWPRLKKLVPAFHDHHIRLVVLSACETARAEDDPQAEVLGLPDSFALAGASAVVASLWSVYTYATTDLMVDFYRRLRVDGMDAASALQSAKIALLRGKEGRYAHPFFWAAFLLFGDWRSK